MSLFPSLEPWHECLSWNSDSILGILIDFEYSWSCDQTVWSLRLRSMFYFGFVFSLETSTKSCTHSRHPSTWVLTSTWVLQRQLSDSFFVLNKYLCCLVFLTCNFSMALQFRQRIQISANLGEWILLRFANYFALFLLKAYTELLQLHF